MAPALTGLHPPQGLTVDAWRATTGMALPVKVTSLGGLAHNKAQVLRQACTQPPALLALQGTQTSVGCLCSLLGPMRAMWSDTHITLPLTGLHCFVLAEIDSCSPNPCLGVDNSDETCIDLDPPGDGYECGCDAGYTWSNGVCAGTQELIHGCLPRGSLC